jgi:hypothetical protein
VRKKNYVKTIAISMEYASKVNVIAKIILKVMIVQKKLTKSILT